MKLIEELNLLSCSYSHVSNAEYLVFRSDGSNISTHFSDKETLAIYGIISTLPFPMNTNHLYEEYIKQVLAGKFSTMLLNSDEYKVIQSVIKNISNDLYILPMPKSMHQLYVYAALAKIQISSTHTKLAEHLIADAFRKLRMPGGRACADLKEDTAHPIFLPLWNIVNACLIQEFAALSSLLPTEENLNQIAKSWLNAITEYWQQTKYAHQFSRPKNLKILEKSLAFEIAIMLSTKESNSYILYRASPCGPLSDVKLLSKEPTLSLSFNNGLLEGMHRDKSANALHYSFIEGHIHQFIEGHYLPLTLYALFVKKDSYLSLQKDGKLMYIPPLHNLARIFGIGEEFHVRSIATKRFITEMAEQNIKPKAWSMINNHHLELIRRESYAQHMQSKVLHDSHIISDYIGPRYALKNMYLPQTSALLSEHRLFKAAFRDSSAKYTSSKLKL